MSKIHPKWLWLIVGAEVALITGLVVWGTVFRQPAPAPKQTATVQPAPTPTYKTPKIELVPFATGLTSPTSVVPIGASGDTRLFVTEQAGTIRSVSNTGVVDPNVFLDIQSKVQNKGEMGLLGLAFHPKVAQNNYFYINYVDKQQNTIIARYTISKTTGLADPASEKVLLKIKQPYANHNGGNLVFGPDGYLYIGMGDGGSGGDPEDRAQNKSELLGKLLRIDVDGGDAYAIPADNPFNKEGGKPEIWALGLRNPWRFSFDRKTADLYIADVGQGDYEEINVQPATSKGGENYGWRCYEGLHTFNATGCQAATNYVQPIIEYDHSEKRCSVTGGYVYRGTKYPALTGKYFYGDYCGGQLYYTSQIAGAWTPVAAATTTYSITAFGQDSTGELYLADYVGGALYHITDTAN